MITRKLLLIIGTALLLCLIAVPPCPAPLINGTLYWRNITPQNDIYEKIVMPGDTIVLGRTYDLTYVSGYSKKYAWWKDPFIQGATCTPDIVINTSYIETNGKIHPNNVTLDSAWRTGDWFQWEGCYQLPYQRGQTTPQYSPYMRDNNLVFHVINDPNPPTPVPTKKPVITATPKPKITTIITTVTIPPEEPKKEENWPWWYYPVGIFLVWLAWRVLW